MARISSFIFCLKLILSLFSAEYSHLATDLSVLAVKTYSILRLQAIAVI